MKIYCARQRPSNTVSVLDSIMGDDVWVEMRSVYSTDPAVRHFIKVIDLTKRYGGEDYYTVYECLWFRDLDQIPLPATYKIDAMTDYMYLPRSDNSEYTLVRPINMLTTNELFAPQ